MSTSASLATPSESDSPLLRAACAYAQAQGWAVFPLHGVDAAGACSCHQPACSRPGKHPHTQHGFKAATTDVRRIRQWWRRWPDANIGIATGRVSGLVVVDVDEDEGGSRTPLEPLPATLTARTGRGEHLYFRLPAGVVIGSKGGSTVGTGIHVRGDGGYVVAPPSRHVSGRQYEWQQDPDCQEPAPLPEHLRRLLTGALAPGAPVAPAAVAASTAPAAPIVPATLEPGPAGDSPLAGQRTPASVPAASPLTVAPPPTGNASAYWLRQAVAKVAAGAGRNTTGFWLACQLRDDGVDPVVATLVLQQYVAAVGARGTHLYTAREAQASLAQAYAQEPRAPAQRHGRLPVVAPPTPADECTDTGNAKRLALAYGPVLRFVAEWGGWVAYADGVWHKQQSALAKRYAQETVQAIGQEATAALSAGDAARYGRLSAHLTRSLNAARLRALLDVAQMYLAAHPADFDADPWLLNLQNGTLNLQTGELHPHQAEDLLTRQAPVTYDAQAPAPTWTAFLGNVFHQDAALIAYVQRALGYSCTAATREQVFFLCYGAGANGKSTLLNAVAQVLGPYARPLKADVLMARAGAGSGPGPDPELASVVGARFVTAQEPHGMTLDTPRLKELTGSDAIQVRELRRAPFTFVPHFKLWLSTNERPSVPETTVGIWRRIRLIPFTASFHGHEDRAMPAKLAAEAPGILNWLLQGVHAWREEGLGMVPAIQEATAAYQAEEDAFAPFFTQVLAPAAHAQRLRLKEAYAAFIAWCLQEGVQPLSEQDFPKEAERHGYPKVVGHARTRYLARCALAPAHAPSSSTSSQECGASPAPAGGGGGGGLGGDDGDDALSVLHTTLKNGALEPQLENTGDIVTTVTQGHEDGRTRPAPPRGRGGQGPRISQRFYAWLREEGQLDDEDIDALTADEVEAYREEYQAAREP